MISSLFRNQLPLMLQNQQLNFLKIRKLIFLARAMATNAMATNAMATEFPRWMLRHVITFSRYI